MASGSVFSATLQTITTTKLEELAQQRAAFDKEYAELLSALEAEQDPLKRVLGLVEGTKSCLGVKTRVTKGGRPGIVVSGGTGNPSLELDLKNLDRFLEQTKFDTSVSEKLIQRWEEKLLQYLSVQASKFQYADLYGKLVTEWLSSEKAAPAQPDADVEMTESFEELPGAKKLSARTEWEKSVFEPAVVDVDALKAYLEELFITDKKEATAAIKRLREKVEDFESHLASPGQFSISTLRWVIKGLQASDLLSNEKREVLKDFLSNSVVLREIGDVLSMRLSALDRWSWGDHVPLEQRRKVNGSFSIHMHEDVLQAIFLHYIGVRWSVFFKSAFMMIRNSDGWKSSCTEPSKTERLRRNWFLGSAYTQTNFNLEKLRDETQRTRYFAHQLLDFNTQEVEMEDGEEEAEYGDYVDVSKKRKNTFGGVPQQRMMSQTARAARAKQTARKSLRSSGYEMEEECEEDDDEGDMGFALFDDDDTPQDRGVKRPMQNKQDLLHILSTEIIVNTRLHGELSCLRTVFESFNPLLPHATVLSILSFFGVSEKWSGFFRKFLQAPLKFIEDAPSTEPKLRQRGTPGSHALSDVFAELTLFCMDFSVNQVTSGSLLHRLYDDVWFWNKDYEVCVKAWEAITRFTQVMGAELNEKKTGSVRINHAQPQNIDERLPQGEIRWGFLSLDPVSGRWELDQKMVDGHINELRTQLASKTSIIDFISAYNSYVSTFLSSNFGSSSNCFGRAHVDSMLATHRRVQASVLGGSSVVAHIKKMIETRFGVSDVPDGFLFFPVELGGLDLKSPFVNLLQIRDAVRENPYDLLDEYEERERDDYAKAKALFARGETSRYRDGEDREWRPEDAETFMSFEEFVRGREVYNAVAKASLRETYNALLLKPSEAPVDVSVSVRQALDQLRGQSNLRGITAGNMDSYWKWITMMYGPEMLERFGGLNIVDPGLLPIGMVGYFRSKRTKWQG